MASPQKIQRAHKLISEFRSKRSATQYFTAFTRDEVARGLKLRVASPDRIDQQRTQLCGVAALLHVLVSDQPDKYVEMVTSLFETGRAYVHETHEWWSGLTIAPDAHLKSYRPAPRDQMNAADWIAMASIRDSANWVFDYETVKDSVFSGGTSSSDIVRWLWRIGGYDMVTDETNRFFNKDESHLHRACQYFMQKYRVLLHINSACLNIDQNSTWSARADHWVVLTKPIKIFRKKVQIEVYSWGQRMKVHQNQLVDKAAFLEHYYGFVAAKY